MDFVGRIAVYVGLAVATSIYAYWLYRSDDREPESGPDPDKTWVLVVFGVSLVLIAHAAATYIGPAPSQGWAAFAPWLAFIVGGVPVIIGELLRTRKRRRKEREFKERNGKRRDKDGGNGST